MRAHLKLKLFWAGQKRRGEEGGSVGQSQGLFADNACAGGREAVGALCVGSTLWLYSLCDMPRSLSVGYAGNAGLEGWRLGVEGLGGWAHIENTAWLCLCIWRHLRASDCVCVCVFTSYMLMISTCTRQIFMSENHHVLILAYFIVRGCMYVPLLRPCVFRQARRRR